MQELQAVAGALSERTRCSQEWDQMEAPAHAESCALIKRDGSLRCILGAAQESSIGWEVHCVHACQTD